MDVRILFCFPPLLKSHSLVMQAGKEDRITEPSEDLSNPSVSFEEQFKVTSLLPEPEKQLPPVL